MNLILAAETWNPLAPFGVTSWEPFFANLIAFLLMVLILRIFAFKPIQAILEKRRERIEEGERMHEAGERELATVEERKKEILREAEEKGQERVNAAKTAAGRLLEERKAEAEKQAEYIIRKEREAFKLKCEEEEREMRAQFAQMLALATTRVTGKILTDEDQRRINEETIASLDS